MKCPRCDWQTDHPDTAGATTRQQLAQHAHDTDHPTCIVCTRILPPEDTRTCEPCITHGRQLLTDIVLMYEQLEHEVGQLRGTVLGGGRGGSDGAPLPGGDVLVLLGPGSQGLDDDALTVRDGDTTSVAFDLAFWETEWRKTRHDKPSRPVRLNQMVIRASGYLEVHSRWAARAHPGWLSYLEDLRALHARLERATGRARIEQKANASCFSCGGTLRRRINPTTGLEEMEPTGRRDPETGQPEQRPVVTCGTCRRRYGPVEYLLALRGARESGLQGWVTVADAAKVSKRSIDTLKSWTRSRADDGPGPVATCCVVTWSNDGLPVQGRQLVWWPDVEAKTGQSQRRSRAAS